MSRTINSTLVSQQTICGGFFNENSSVTWIDVSPSIFNDTRSNPPGFTKVGYDKINFPSTNVALYGAGIALNQHGKHSNTGMIDLGKDSVFLNDAVRQALASSRSWSLDAGSQSPTNPRNGELVIGGCNAGRTDGSFSWSYVSDMAGDRPWPLRTKTTNTSITLSSRDIIPIKSSAEIVEACIKPYDNLYRFTAGMLLNWKQITAVNETLFAVYSNETANNISFTELGLPYGSSRVGDWSLSITLDRGYKTTFPAYGLQRPLLGFDNLGNKVAVPGITNLQILDVPTGEGEVPTLGEIFLSRSYLGVNYDNDQFGLALAEVDAQLNNYIHFGCGNGGNSNWTSKSNPGDSSLSLGTSVPIAPIVGGTVGGVALLTLAAILFWWTRRRKQNPVAEIHVDPNEAQNLGVEQRDTFQKFIPSLARGHMCRNITTYVGPAASDLAFLLTAIFKDLLTATQARPQSSPSHGVYEVPGQVRI